MALKNSRISVSLNQAAKELNISIDDIINIAANTENKIKVSLYVHEADTDFKCPSELFNRQFITFLAGINTPNGVIQFIDYSGLSWDGLGGWKTVSKGISHEIKQRQYRHCDTNRIEQVRLQGFWDVLNPLDILHGKGLIKLHLGMHNEARISGEPIQAWTMKEIKTGDLVLLNDCYDELRAITVEMLAQNQTTSKDVTSETTNQMQAVSIVNNEYHFHTNTVIENQAPAQSSSAVAEIAEPEQQPAVAENETTVEKTSAANQETDAKEQPISVENPEPLETPTNNDIDAKELQIANKAYTFAKKNFTGSGSPKELIKKYLDTYHPALGQNARNRIILTANWDKNPGRKGNYE